MDKAKNSKNFIIIIVIFIVIVGACYMYATRDKTPDDLLIGVAGGSREAVDKDLISALSSLKSRNLDDAVLKENTWKSLEDFSIKIAPQEWGRSNPFEPVKGNVNTVSSSR